MAEAEARRATAEAGIVKADAEARISTAEAQAKIPAWEDGVDEITVLYRISKDDVLLKTDECWPAFDRSFPKRIAKVYNNPHPRFFSPQFPRLKNIYEIDPEKLSDEFGEPTEKTWHFITLHSNGFFKLPTLEVVGGIGYWKVLRETDGMKYFQYYRGKYPDGLQTDWLMDMEKLPAPPRIDTYVKCKIYLQPEEAAVAVTVNYVLPPNRVLEGGIPKSS
ncbi:unnamed protein product [Cuscuta epithymum]|uniref:NAC domain-containing protein n=1 Tax=Cuscuta epithymum TaxID=186058 RepID=A0AAV0BWZ8_9ASTE|nr:unnamed protein product [Cuscuta epithymum]